MTNIRKNDEEMNPMYHNLDKALKIYRVVAAVIREAPRNVRNELSAQFADFDELIYKMDIMSTFGSEKTIRLEQRLRTLARTRELIEKINRALSQLPTLTNGEMYFNILFDSYVADERLDDMGIMKKYDIPRSTFYRYKASAKKHLGDFIWMNDGEILEDIDDIIDSLKIQWAAE